MFIIPAIIAAYSLGVTTVVIYNSYFRDRKKFKTKYHLASELNNIAWSTLTMHKHLEHVADEMCHLDDDTLVHLHYKTTMSDYDDALVGYSLELKLGSILKSKLSSRLVREFKLYIVEIEEPEVKKSAPVPDVTEGITEQERGIINELRETDIKRYRRTLGEK